jgi:L-lactate dehydrogenase complex protein LldG
MKEIDCMGDPARDAILKRVRQALSAPSEIPSWLNQPSKPGPVFPLPANEPNACRDRFREEFTALFGEFHEFDSVADAKCWLANWLAENNIAGPILAAGDDRLGSFLSDLVDAHWVRSDRPARELAACPVGMTQCESLVAESGTISVSAGLTGRAGTILPPIHLVVATKDQLVPDLDTSLSRLRERYGERLPSTMSWITGPSRTGDIEKILVLGAHGPKRLILLLLPSDALTPL